MKNINIKFIPFKEQRYETYGDYWKNKNGDWEIRVSQELGDWQENLACAIHEIIEFALLETREIKEEVVMNFDKKHISHPDPGFHPESPYHNEHYFAHVIDNLIIEELKKQYAQKT